jgi:hypothetical protein
MIVRQVYKIEVVIKKKYCYCYEHSCRGRTGGGRHATSTRPGPGFACSALAAVSRMADLWAAVQVQLGRHLPPTTFWNLEKERERERALCYASGRPAKMISRRRRIIHERNHAWKV